MLSTTTSQPNHHGDHPGFSGIGGLVAALGFTVGRAEDAELAARLVGLTADDTLVDIGCGPGVAVKRAASLGARAIGVDPAAVMLRVARMVNRGDRIRYVEGAAEALPLEDDSVTVAWSIATVHHWPDLEGGLREVQRVLRPGGRFLAIERSTRPGARGHASHGWTDEQAEAFAGRCRDLGFSDVTIATDRVKRGRLVSVRAVTS